MVPRHEPIRPEFVANFGGNAAYCPKEHAKKGFAHFAVPERPFGPIPGNRLRIQQRLSRNHFTLAHSCG